MPPSPHRDAHTCPACHTACRWTPERAGRRVRCACGQVFGMPANPEGPVITDLAPPKPTAPSSPKSAPPPEPDVYEVDLPDDMAQHATPADTPLAASEAMPHAGPTPGKCPSCNGRLRDGAVICLNCGFSLAQGGKIQTRIDTDPQPDSAAADETTRPADPGAPRAASGPGAPNLDDERLNRAVARAQGEQKNAAAIQNHYRFQEHTLPLILIGAGVVVALFNALVFAQSSENAGLTPDEVSLGMGTSRGEAAINYFKGAAALLVIQIPCLLAGLFFCAAVMGSAFGTLGTALKKLLALALLGGSLYLSISMGVNIIMYGVGGLGGLFTASIALAVFWSIIALLFDGLEKAEVVILYIAMCVLPFFILAGIQLFIFR